MPRIAGVNIPENKRIVVALTYIYGIGDTLSGKIIKEANLDPNLRAGKMSPEEVNRLREIVEKKFKVEGDLRRDVQFNIKRLKDIKSYRGVRHYRGLPLRGQRTKTNARTGRGKRKTVGSGRKNAPASK